jgi:hypothetical protein
VSEYYGNIAAKTFDRETAAIDDLLRELNERHVAGVALLGLNDCRSLTPDSVRHG